MKQSKKGPVAPSARNQLVDGAVTPAEPCPAAKAWVGVLRYIARSTMIGSAEVMTAETSVAARTPPIASTGIVVRELGGSEYCRSIGAWPKGRRKRIVTLVAVWFAFCS